MSSEVTAPHLVKLRLAARKTVVKFQAGGGVPTHLICVTLYNGAPRRPVMVGGRRRGETAELTAARLMSRARLASQVRLMDILPYFKKDKQTQ